MGMKPGHNTTTTRAHLTHALSCARSFATRGAVALTLLLAAQLPAAAQFDDAPEPVRRPSFAAGRAVLQQADAHRGLKILVSTDQRRLWLVLGRDTLLNVPVAIGMGKSFEYEGRRFWFETPRGKRSVLRKEEKPLWNVPEWHYLERAKQYGHPVVALKKEDKIELKDGRFLITIGNNVGLLNERGHFWPITPGNEIIFDDVIYIPPTGTAQRLVPDALGPFKLDTGEGYLIHGTHIYNEETIGEAVSHGCVRMRNADLDRLYHMVPVGTPVFIF